MKNFKKILSCWNKMEYFTPAPLPKDKNTVELVGSIPWENPVIDLPKGKTVEYTVFMGVFDSKQVSDFVKKHFNDTNKNENERNTKICLASLKVDNNGNYINDSLGISTLPWALNQLQRGNLDSDDWNTDFANLKELIFSEFKYVFNTIDSEDDNQKVKIQLHQLREIESRITSESGWKLGDNTKMYVQKNFVYVTKKNTSSAEILNSYYSKDIENIISKLEKTSPSFAFNEYMQGSLNQKKSRIDLTGDDNELKDTLVPNMIPDGCWPSEHSLSMMQQFAVNRIFKSLGDSDQGGLLSVNGPPGTGKTTLLRDIIAPIIVKRAKKLAEIETPSNSLKFIRKLETESGRTPFIYQLDEELCDGGIVVASSNNGAVENISKELPLFTEVGPYANEIEYFKQVAETCISKNNWGLVSAVLGKKENRNDLTSRIWWNKEVNDLQKTLKSTKADDLPDWKSIVSDFNSKLQEVTNEKEKLEIAKTQYEEYLKLSKKRSNQNPKIEALKKSILAKKSILDRNNEKIEELNQSKKDYLNEFSILKSNRPNIFIYLFNFKIRKEYKKSLNNLFKNYNEISQAYEKLKKEINDDAINLGHLQDKERKHRQELDQIIFQLKRLEPSVLDATKYLGNNYADYEFWSDLKSEVEEKASIAQQSCPWYSSKLKKLQSELFILSLKLNEQFILRANSKSNRILTTLAGFFEYMNGNTNPDKEDVKAMWNTFFLVIPVISSTFASIQTMFKDLDKDDLPWLFVDEAGQAVPQAAAGAIWRSKRVVVVGDPFQIEPVVTIPEIIINNLGKYFGLGEELINSEVSVQSISDRINPWGAYLNLNSKDVWVGIPLRVHRRCLNPMFSISNAIAYDNTMYTATKEPKKYEITMDNAFIHCTGQVEGKHFVPAQANIVEKLLIEEIDFCQGFPAVFIITPFSEISYKLRSALFAPLKKAISRYHRDLSINQINDWLKSHIGTVHTFQGKEAKGVIMCLGIDEKTQGAAQWASSKPNLLNVALTRAKHRFVAIGDKNIWLKQPYFKELTTLNMN